MGFAKIEKLLAARLGFDVETIGPKAVKVSLKRATDEAGFSDPDEYASILARDPEAWDWFVDRIVIPESWFFRDAAPFDFAVELARAHLRSQTGKVFRILSCPCSTGEEPYSLVMAMLCAGIPADSFAVEAADVSLTALKSARAAKFRTRSFRDKDLWYRAAYFERIDTEGIWHLNKSLRALVRFRRENCIDPVFLHAEPAYELIFCRNLLIYLHAEAREVVIKALRRLLTDNGVIVFGNTEPAIARQHGLNPVGPLNAFAFGKHKAHVAPGKKAIHARKTPGHFSARPHASAAKHETRPGLAHATKLSEIPQDPERLLTDANRLGDAGRLHEAVELCHDYLRQAPGSAKGYYLLGVLQDALGHPKLATDSFKKVLYLDPNHRDALLHLALKREADGDTSGAALLRARARRFSDKDASGRR